MNLLAVESLRNIDQFAKQIGFAAERQDEIGPRSFAWHRGGFDPLSNATAQQVVAIAVRQVDRLGVRPVAHTRPRSSEIFEPGEKVNALWYAEDSAAPLKPSGAYRKTAPLSRGLEWSPVTAALRARLRCYGANGRRKLMPTVLRLGVFGFLIGKQLQQPIVLNLISRRITFRFS
jgi:hypothetical protein